MSQHSADVIVVGGGINGAAVLYHLVQRGVRDCLLIERGRIAGGPTGVSSAIVRQHYQSETYSRMALDSVRVFQRFTELTGGDAAYRAIGYVALVRERGVPPLRATIAMHQRIGIRTSFVTTAEISELEPLADVEGLGGGAYEPESGHADPVWTANGFIASAMRGGAAVWRDTAVTRLLTNGDRVVGVETSQGSVFAERVVVAAGPWTAGLARGVGVELPIRSSRHPVVLFECSAGQRARHVVADAPNQVYLRPEGTDLLLVGGLAAAPIGSDADPDVFDGRPTRAEEHFFTERALARYPALASARSRAGWAGIYDMSPDGWHIIDELSTARGCVVVCGTSGHGFKLGPAVGALAADLVLGRELQYDANAFRLSRFASKAYAALPR